MILSGPDYQHTLRGSLRDGRVGVGEATAAIISDARKTFDFPVKDDALAHFRADQLANMRSY
jgi:hypothetical protein